MLGLENSKKGILIFTTICLLFFSHNTVVSAKSILSEYDCRLKFSEFSSEDCLVVRNAYKIAESALMSNYGDWPNVDGKIIYAGSKVYKEPWARDLVIPLEGSLFLNRTEEVKGTLQLFINHQKFDGQYPTYFINFLPFLKPPLYTSPVGTTTVDSTPFMIIGVAKYIEKTNDTKFLKENFASLEQAMNWTISKDKDKDYLIEEEPFGDWIDSVNRGSKVSFTNIVYFKALSDFSHLSELAGESEKADYYHQLAMKVKDRINEFFWTNDGYYKSSDKFNNFATDSNMLAIVWNVATREQGLKIEEKIKELNLTNPVPMRIVYPDYPLESVSVPAFLLGITDYQTHDSWPWLGGYDIVAKAKLNLTRDAKQEFLDLARIIVRDNSTYEVYDSRGLPLKSFFYKAEQSATYTAGTFIYAFGVIMK